MNQENEFSYNFFQYTIVSHVLTLGYAAMAAGLVYFLVTRSSVSARYRLSSTLSAVVMASAFLELYVLSARWTEAFAWNGSAYVLQDELFSNGYRYVNWSIDVPVLLTQLLIVVGVTGAAFRKAWAGFVVLGLLMIYTGYAGQFYEVDGSAPFWIWGSISTVFYLVLLVMVYRVCYGNLSRLPARVHGMVKGVFWLLFGSWMLYPGGYLMPIIWDSADGVVARQITYTVADITSKILYGVLLGVIAQRISADEGYAEAAEGDVTQLRGGISEIEAPGRV